MSTVQQYKYRDLTVREITNVISQYKDLKPVMDSYGKNVYNTSQNMIYVLLYACLICFIE